MARRRGSNQGGERECPLRQRHSRGTEERSGNVGVSFFFAATFFFVANFFVHFIMLKFLDLSFSCVTASNSWLFFFLQNRKLRHPNLVLLIGVSTKGPHVCLVEEYVNNASLYTVLHERQKVFALKQVQFSFTFVSFRVRLCLLFCCALIALLLLLAS